MGVNLGNLQQYFGFYDFKGGGQDGKLSRSEMAHAAQDLILNGNEEEQKMGLMFATILQGGKDGEGAFSLIDRNRDEGINLCEFQQLAELGGGANCIDSQDFQAAMGDRYHHGGRGVDIRRLQMMGMDNYTAMPGYQPLTPEQVFANRQQAQDPIGALEQIRSNLDPNSPEARQIDQRIRQHQIGALEQIRSNLDPYSPEAQQVNQRINELRGYQDPYCGQQQQNPMMLMMMQLMQMFMQMLQMMGGGGYR